MQGTQQKGFGDHVVKALPFILAILTVFVVWRSLDGTGSLNVPAVSKPGTQVLKEYSEKKTEKERLMLVLEEMANGNIPSKFHEFETIRITGQFGTVVEFKAARTNRRLGTNDDWAEIPLPGAYAQAGVMIYSKKYKPVSLSTCFMAEAIYLQAKANGGKVTFFSVPTIARRLGIKFKKQDELNKYFRTPAFISKRNELLKKWLKGDGFDPKGEKNEYHKLWEKWLKDPDPWKLTSGYFKEVVHPIKGLTSRKGIKIRGREFFGKHGKLEICGAYHDDGRPIQAGGSSGKHPMDYFDYSHGDRYHLIGSLRVKKKEEEDWKKMSLNEFHTTVKLAEEFRFQATDIEFLAYPIPDDLKKWLQDKGYWVEPPPKEKVVVAPKAKGKAKKPSRWQKYKQKRRQKKTRKKARKK